MARHAPPSRDAHDRWQPRDHEPYFVILGHGRVHKMAWQSTPFDHEAWAFGNCFRTRSDAERAREALQACLRALHRAQAP